MSYEKAAPGVGVLLYFRDTDNTHKVIVSLRGKIVGEGYGVTGGGFVDCNRIIQKSIGTISFDYDQAYRELCEEFADAGAHVDEGMSLKEAKAIAKDFVKALPYEVFRQRHVTLSSVSVRTDDSNKIHHSVFLACEVSQHAAREILAIAGNNERLGSEAVTIGSQKYTQVLSDLYHQHERVAFQALEARLNPAPNNFM